MNQRLTLLMPQAQRQPHLTGVTRYLETGERRIRWSGVALTGLHRNGGEIPLEVSFGEQLLDGRRLFIGVLRDVTEQRRYQRELRDAAAQLERRNAELARSNLELEEFGSIASHDLQEPLRKLVSFSSLLREDLPDDLPPDAARDLEFIDDGARRMQRMIRDLLALSRAGREPVRNELVAVAECVGYALEDLELRVRESKARIERCPLPMLQADPTLLTGIYRNLLGNAIKFAGSDPPKIHLTAEQIEDEWVLGVADSGPGIAADQHEEAFKPFRRLDPGGGSEGSGIGLAFCRRAVERHGGRIWIESEPGQGSHFRFTLEAPRAGELEEPR